MGIEPKLEHAALLDDVLGALDEADGASWREKAARAATFLKQAVARGATATAAYWKERYKNALAQGQKSDPKQAAKAEPPAADDDGPEVTIEPPEDDAPEVEKPAKKQRNPFAPPDDDTDADVPEKPSAAEKPAKQPRNPFGPPEDDAEKPADDAEKPADAAEKPADDAEKPADDAEKPADDAEKPADDADLPPDEQTVDPDAEDVDVDGLSEDEARLVQNKKHRQRVGKEAAGEVAGKRKGILAGIGSLLSGVAGAVGAVGNWVTGGLSSLDAKTLGKAAGSLVFAALGGLAFGGVGALAGMALAQYFASRSASTQDESVAADVQRAFMLAEKKDAAQAGQAQWATHVLDSVQRGFENLGEMDPKELAAVLKAAKRFKKDLLPPSKKGG